MIPASLTLFARLTLLELRLKAGIVGVAFQLPQPVEIGGPRLADGRR